MFDRFRSGAAHEALAKLAALDKSQAVIEFAPDGIILTANANFLDAMGYALDEIRGQHHGMFVEPAVRQSEGYRNFWEALRRGEYQSGQFKRISKDGREVWIEASYNPILRHGGKPFKVVKYATVVTAQKTEFADLHGQLAAIKTSQAVIEFALDGTILTANQRFLDLVGYTLAEIRGKHHAMFVDPAYRQSAEYRAFWERLNAGEFQAAQFKRLGKDGKVVWIEACYNPIRDLNGRPCKVVKYATDITEQVCLLMNLKLLIDRNFGAIDAAVSQSDAQAHLAADAVHKTSAEMQAMAASTEELAASVREIASMMAQSNAATDAAHAQTSEADSAIRRLAERSDAMENIIALIRNIAGQINLLALNATIESARAGDAGKGFAVVAGEVKSLAQHAADATNQIAREIEELQAVSGDVVSALGSISHSIASLRQYSSTTAAAIEEQSAVTQGLSAAMQTTTATVQAINDNMSDISSAVQKVAHAMDDTRSAARVLVR
ncbi:MAG: PAS domain-containing methyl-accepting chemotaxis protein [Alphaproteobacteria bacterium]|nr:PAS domain-containing methyl-accepting chemotaxis protein [Alphaproteobacteria bacterium]